MTDKQILETRPGRINSLGGVRREMCRIYMQAQGGHMKIEDMSRYVNCLQIILGAIREADLEKRMELIEKSINDLGHPL